jgi:hypothetical protein
VSAPKNKKKAMSGDSKHSSSKRRKEKLIRLDDLIPKQNVTGGRQQLLFGVTDAIQTTKTTNNPKQES